MAVILLRPEWFIGHDVFLELIFAIVALFVGYYSYKVHKLTKSNNAKYFSISFVLLSIAYLILSITNFLTFLLFNKLLFTNTIQASQILLLNNFGLYTYALVYSAGITYLVFTTFKNRSNNQLLLIALLVLIPLIFGKEKALLFHLLTTLMLLFVTSHYCDLYLRKKKKETLIMMLSFILFLVGRLLFVLSLNRDVYYFLGHLLELFAYLLLLINLLRVLKK